MRNWYSTARVLLDGLIPDCESNIDKVVSLLVRKTDEER